MRRFFTSRLLLTLAAGFAGLGVTLLAPSPAYAACDPNYSGQCLPPFTGDAGAVDCPDLPGPVTVVGADPYRLDADGDGTGCEDGTPADPDVVPGGACTEEQEGEDAVTDGRLYACTANGDGTFTWVEVTQGGEDGGALPKTGVNGGLAAAAGAALLGAGGLLVWSTRRRPGRHTA